MTNQIKDGFLNYHEIFRREQSVLTGWNGILIIKDFVNYLMTSVAGPDIKEKDNRR